jgi:hypothetical protein
MVLWLTTLLLTLVEQIIIADHAADGLDFNPYLCYRDVWYR